MIDVKKTDNLIMRVLLETIQNVVGANGLKSILNYAHLKKYIDSFPPENHELDIPIEDFHNVMVALVRLFGHKGASSLKIKVGRNILLLARKKRPKIAGAIRLAIRFLPETQRMKVALKGFIKEIEKRLPLPSKKPYLKLQEEKEYFLITDKVYSESKGVKSKTPNCFIFVGMLLQLMELVTGHQHEVEEIRCKAMGDEVDVFKIMKVHKDKE